MKAPREVKIPATTVFIFEMDEAPDILEHSPEMGETDHERLWTLMEKDGKQSLLFGIHEGGIGLVIMPEEFAARELTAKEVIDEG